MSSGQSPTSNQDGLLALVSASHQPSQQMRSVDDDESLILCSLAKSRPACRRRGYDSTSSKEATRLSVSSATLEPSIVEEEENEVEEEEDAEEEEDEELHMITSPVIDVIEKIQKIPYEEITESFRKDINQMMGYDTLVNSIAAHKRAESALSIRQRPSVPTSPQSGSTGRVLAASTSTNSPFRYASTTVSRVTDKDMEKLREFVRMDRGLPLTKTEKRKLVEYKKEPAVRPKMNRASAIRTQHIRKCSLSWSSTKSSSFDLDASIRSREEEMMKRVKKMVARQLATASDQPLYKYNKGFEMRYQANKGNPIMPSSFRDSYEAFNKPLFSVAGKLKLPKRYLWPEHRKNHISLLGFNIETGEAPPQYQETKIVRQKKTRKLARPPVRKTQRVLRVKPTSQPKPKKTPWNYGVFERTSKRLEHH